MRCQFQLSIWAVLVCSIWSRSPRAYGQSIRVDGPDEGSTSIYGRPKIAQIALVPDEPNTQGNGEEVPVNITEQVAINRTNANPSYPPSEQEQPVPMISAILFDGSPGPKDCRGNAILNVRLTKPGAQHLTPTCYNVPGVGVAQCANFLANKDDGCQARVFTEPDCKTFANVVVFIPEMRAFGGLMRSVEIQCGVVSEAPPPLDLPGLVLPANAMQAVG